MTNWTIASVGGTAEAFVVVAFSVAVLGTVELVAVAFNDGALKGWRPLKFFSVMRSVTDTPNARASSA